MCTHLRECLDSTYSAIFPDTIEKIPKDSFILLSLQSMYPTDNTGRYPQNYEANYIRQDFSEFKTSTLLYILLISQKNVKIININKIQEN